MDFTTTVNIENLMKEVRKSEDETELYEKIKNSNNFKQLTQGLGEVQKRTSTREINPIMILHSCEKIENKFLAQGLHKTDLEGSIFFVDLFSKDYHYDPYNVYATHIYSTQFVLLYDKTGWKITKIHRNKVQTANIIAFLSTTTKNALTDKHSKFDI